MVSISKSSIILTDLWPNRDFFSYTVGTRIVCSVYEIKITHYIVQEYENNTLRWPLIYSPNKRELRMFSTTQKEERMLTRILIGSQVFNLVKERDPKHKKIVKCWHNKKEQEFWRGTYSQKALGSYHLGNKNHSFNPGLWTKSDGRGNSPISQVLAGSPPATCPVCYHSPQQISSVPTVPLHCIYVSLTPGKDLGKRYP